MVTQTLNDTVVEIQCFINKLKLKKIKNKCNILLL